AEEMYTRSYATLSVPQRRRVEEAAFANTPGRRLEFEVALRRQTAEETRRIDDMQDRLEELEEKISEQEATSETQYEQYTLPGEKSNYKEILVTLPWRRRAVLPEGWSVDNEAQDGIYRVYDDDNSLVGQGVTRDQAIADELGEPESAASPVFQSP